MCTLWRLLQLVLLNLAVKLENGNIDVDVDTTDHAYSAM